MSGASFYTVNANSHSKTSKVVGNFLGGSEAIATSGTYPNHIFLANTGNKAAGQGSSITLDATPAIYKVGNRLKYLASRVKQFPVSL